MYNIQPSTSHQLVYVLLCPVLIILLLSERCFTLPWWSLIQFMFISLRVCTQSRDSLSMLISSKDCIASWSTFISIPFAHVSLTDNKCSYSAVLPKAYHLFTYIVMHIAMYSCRTHILITFLFESWQCQWEASIELLMLTKQYQINILYMFAAESESQMLVERLISPCSTLLITSPAVET